MTAKRVARDAALALAGAAGAACILWFLASAFLGATLVLFRTGSMAPTMPTGTAAIAVPVQADDIRVGDVLMIERDGRLPVTHRVLTVAEGPSGSVELRMQGDDNGVPDPEPYRVTEAMRIVFPIPGLGTAVALMRTPIFLGAATLLVAGLVFWAFWPSRSGDAPSTSDDEPSTSDDEGDPMDTEPNARAKQLEAVTGG